MRDKAESNYGGGVCQQNFSFLILKRKSFNCSANVMKISRFRHACLRQLSPLIQFVAVKKKINCATFQIWLRKPAKISFRPSGFMTFASRIIRPTEANILLYCLAWNLFAKKKMKIFCWLEVYFKCQQQTLFYSVSIFCQQQLMFLFN